MSKRILGIVFLLASGVLQGQIDRKYWFERHTWPHYRITPAILSRPVNTLTVKGRLAGPCNEVFLTTVVELKKADSVHDEGMSDYACEGPFRFEGVTPGHYEVTVRPPLSTPIREHVWIGKSSELADVRVDIGTFPICSDWVRNDLTVLDERGRAIEHTLVAIYERKYAKRNVVLKLRHGVPGIMVVKADQNGTIPLWLPRERQKLIVQITAWGCLPAWIKADELNPTVTLDEGTTTPPPRQSGMNPDCRGGES